MLTGLLVVADKPNLNGIIYPRAVVQKMVDELNEVASKEVWLVYPESSSRDEFPYRHKLADAVGFVVDSKILENGAWEAQVKIINPEFLKIINAKKYGFSFNMTVMAGINTHTNIVKDDARLVDISFTDSKNFGDFND